jgi:alpha/beta superfamily hydrolase
VSRSSYRVRFLGGNGFELAGIVDRPDDLPSFPIAVFSHCFTCSKDLKVIVRVSRGLAERGIAVLRFDMTGLGGSDGDFSDTNFTTNVSDLQAAIRFAATDLGPVTALVGHSFGGAASLAVAGLSSDSVPELPLKAVITLAAPSDTQHLAWLLAKMDSAVEATGVGTVTIGDRSWKIRRQMLEDLRRHDLPAMISKIEAATLLFHSPVDATLGFDHAIRIMGLIQAAPARQTPVSLISLDGADHLLADSLADIEYVTATVAAFLKRYAQP